MMTAVVWGSALAAVTWLVALHLLSIHRPQAQRLPTARFIPDVPARQISRQRRLRDVLLLVLRCVVITLMAAALAPPVIAVRRAGLARVILLDVSRAAPSMDRDSLERAGSTGARTVRVLQFSDSVRDGAESSSDTSAARGRLSVGLIAAMREGYRLADAHERVEIVVVSPVVAEELDAGTARIAESWPGELRLDRVPPAQEDAPTASYPVEHRIDILESEGAAVRLAFGTEQPQSLRIVRSAGEGDSAFAASGGVVVVWPAGEADSVRVRAIVSDRSSFVAPLGRPRNTPQGEVLAWWEDGEPALVEQTVGRGCLRWLGFQLPQRGDVALRPGLTSLLRTLSAPCGMRDFTPVGDSAVAFLSRSAGSSGITHATTVPTWLPRVLLVLAILMLFLEQWMRREKVGAARPSPNGATA